MILHVACLDVILNIGPTNIVQKYLDYWISLQAICYNLHLLQLATVSPVDLQLVCILTTLIIT